MFFGFFLFIVFAAIGIYAGVEFVNFANDVVTMINGSANSEFAKTIIDFLKSIGVSITGTGTNLHIDNIPGWTSFLISIPFFIVSLIGLAIIILTQRTTTAKRRNGVLRKKVMQLTNSDYAALTSDEIKGILNKNKINYKENWKKSKLVKIAEKKIK